MIQLLLILAIAAFVIGFRGMVVGKKAEHRLAWMAVWGSSFYFMMFAIFESL